MSLRRTNYYAECKGGPLDGYITVVPDAALRWYFPTIVGKQCVAYRDGLSVPLEGYVNLVYLLVENEGPPYLKYEGTQDDRI